MQIKLDASNFMACYKPGFKSVFYEIEEYPAKSLIFCFANATSFYFITFVDAGGHGHTLN